MSNSPWSTEFTENDLHILEQAKAINERLKYLVGQIQKYQPNHTVCQQCIREKQRKN